VPRFNQKISSVNQCAGDRQSGMRRPATGDTVILWRQTGAYHRGYCQLRRSAGTNI